MFVVSLIGRYADETIAFDMPISAAQSAISFGTHRAATEEEVLKAGFVMDVKPTGSDPEEFPPGYSAKIDNGGYALFFTDAEGGETEVSFHKNSAEARSAAIADAAAKSAALTPVDPVVPATEDAVLPVADEPVAATEEAKPASTGRRGRN